MPYAHLDDRFYGNPKILSTPLPAVGLYCLGLSYCNAQLTDGFIPRSAVAGWGGWAAAAKTLVARNLWEAVTDGFRVHDFLDWNPSREQVLEERAAARQRKTRWKAGRTEDGTRPERVPPVSTPPHSTPDGLRPSPDPLNPLTDGAPFEAPPRRASPTEAQVCPICRRTFLGPYSEHQCDPLQRPKRRPGLGRLLPREARVAPPPEVLAELDMLEKTRADRQAAAARMAQEQA